MKRNFLLLTLPMLLLAPQGAPGRERPSGAPEPPAGVGVQGRWENLQSLREGQRIQVVQMDLKSFTGGFLGVSDEAIRIRMKKEERTIPRSEVFRVSARTASRRGRNALIGVAIGAGLGAAAGAGLLYGTGGSDFAGAIVGATTAIGAGIGAGLGGAFPGYSTVYRAAKRTQPPKP